MLVYLLKTSTKIFYNPEVAVQSKQLHFLLLSEKLSECFFQRIFSCDLSRESSFLFQFLGMLHKSLDLAFKMEQFDTLQQVATSLDAESDPALIEKCADYFVSNQQFDKAVDLLAVGKKVCFKKQNFCFYKSSV